MSLPCSRLSHWSWGPKILASKSYEVKTALRISAFPLCVVTRFLDGQFFDWEQAAKHCCNGSAMYLSSCSHHDNFKLSAAMISVWTSGYTDRCKLGASVQYWREHLGKREALKLDKDVPAAWVGWSPLSNPTGTDKKGTCTACFPLRNEQYWHGRSTQKGICFCLHFLLILSWNDAEATEKEK